MSWIARIEIDTEKAFAHDIVDGYACHQRLWECFPNMPEKKRDFLSRFDQLEGRLRLWLLAQSRPVCPKWCQPEDFSVKEISSSFLLHHYFAFDLRANPTRCVSLRKTDGAMPRHGKRVPLTSPKELREWLDRKAENGGFKIVKEKPLEIGPLVQNFFRRKGKNGCHGSVQFRGILSVTDFQKFAKTYYAGVGSAKSFGFGMLLLAPVNL